VLSNGFAAMVALLVVGTTVGHIWANTSDVAGALAGITNVVSVVGIVVCLIILARNRQRRVAEAPAQPEDAARFGRRSIGYCRRMAGISVGGLIVIIGIVVAIFWSVLWGVIIALVGLLAFGGFARGRWY
jgi:hypothetical protein